MGTDPGDSSSHESETGSGSRPRALIHKKILDMARSNPDASISSIASDVSGASETFVKRVCEEYNVDIDDEHELDSTDQSEHDDMAEPNDNTGNVSGKYDDHDPDGSDAEVATSTDIKSSDLTDKQRETLRVVANHPMATQEEVANKLGVSRATVSKRLSDIEEFEWQSRKQFVGNLFTYRGGNARSEQKPPETRQASPSVSQDQVTALSERVDELESEIQRQGSTHVKIKDPELIRKLVHAAFDAEYISRDEELQLLRYVIPSRD